MNTTMKESRKHPGLPAGHRHVQSDESGVALILVLLLIVLLSVIVAEFAYEAEVQASLTAGASDGFYAYVAAKSAVNAGMGALHADVLQQMLSTAGGMGGIPGGGANKNNPQGEIDDSDSVMDPWAQDVPLPELNGAKAKCWVTDEGGKLNLNALITPQGQRNEFLIETLKALFRDMEVDESVVDAIVEWVTPEELAGEELGLIDTPYGAKQGMMDSIEELLLIPGITPAIYFDLNQQPNEQKKGLFDEETEQPRRLGLPDLLTVYGDPMGAVNVNTVQAPLLAAMLEAGGGSPGDAEQLVEEIRMDPIRNMGDQRLASLGLGGAMMTPGQLPIGAGGAPENKGAKPTQTGSAEGEKDTDKKTPPNDNPALPTQTGSAVTNKSNFYRIQGEGKMGSSMVRIEAFVYRNPMSMGLMDTLNGVTPKRNDMFGSSNKNDRNKEQDRNRNAGNRTQGKNTFGTKNQGEGEGPVEAFKILDWRIVR